MIRLIDIVLDRIEFDGVLIVEFRKDDFMGDPYLLEHAIWKDYPGKKGWSYRIDPEKPELRQQRHAVVCKTKHRRAKTKQVSWNVDGSRHDNKTFKSNLHGLKAAKIIAVDVLGLGPDITLEHKLKPGSLLLEAQKSFPPGLLDLEAHYFTAQGSSSILRD